VTILKSSPPAAAPHRKPEKPGYGKAGAM